jgi:hypothetical protein
MSDSLPEGPPGSRFANVSRRAFLQRSAAAAGLLAIGGLSACSGGNGDTKVFSSATSTSTPAASAGATAAGGPATSATAAPSATTLPAAAKLAVSFTYTSDSFGGRVNNPYIAVWIEDSKGDLVRALAVWYKSDKVRYLSELQEWSATSGSDSALAAVSGATRTPGGYDLVWDGTNLDGTRADTGQYFVCIESAREHGPYSLIRQEITVGSAPSNTPLPSNGELTNAGADYRVA